MKAVFFKEHGGPEKLLYGDQPDPTPQENEALVRVRACALNHLDIWVRNGLPAYPVNLPHILGSDISGEVVAFGSKSELSLKGLKIGSPVVVSPGIACWACEECLKGRDNLCKTAKIVGAYSHGGYAEYARVPLKNLFPKPPHLTFEEAASFPLVFLTAWHMLVSRANLKQGDIVLVLGAGSGVGSAAIQIAKAQGSTVIAVSSSDEKLAQAKKLGADFTVNGEKEDFSLAARKLTDGRGVDIVFEHVGPATLEKSIKSLSRGGKIVTCGATTGPVATIDLRVLFMKDLSILGSKLGTLSEFEHVLKLVGGKKISPVVSKTFPLSEARAAHEFLENKEQFGKVVLSV